MTVKTIFYSELVYLVYKEIMQGKFDNLTFIKDKTKYRIANFKKTTFLKISKQIILSYLSKLDKKTTYLIIDTCLCQDNELFDLYGQKLTNKKLAICNNSQIKYYFTERNIKLPEDSIAELFDKLFNKWFEKHPYKNIYFIRSKSLPASEVYYQLKEKFKSILSQYHLTDDNVKVKDLNNLVYSKINNHLNYKPNIELITYVEKILFPYEEI